jgi:two-component system OmpR family response regulator
MFDSIMQHILVVDDDPGIRRLVTDYLTEEGFRVTAVGTVGEMRSKIRDQTPNLILLDLILPDQDGLTVARELRSRSDVAIIIITGKDEPIDRVVGLELGADDYVTKPFHLRELLARIRSVLRRSNTNVPTDKSAETEGVETHKQRLTSGNVAEFDEWRLDLAGRRLLTSDGQSVELGSVEFRLMELFVNRPNEVLDRDTLLQIIYNREWQPFDRSIDVQMARLRKKIESDSKLPEKLKTVRGTGYVFTPKVIWHNV